MKKSFEWFVFGCAAVALVATIIFGGAFFYLWIDWPHSVQVLTERGLGDPMSLQQGVSVWPCIALRAMTLTLSLWLIFFAWWKLGFNIAEITDHMKIEYKPKKNNSGDANPVLRQSAETCDTPAEQMTASKIERQLPEICDMQQPWDRYIANGHPVIKAIRIIGYVLAMCLFSLLLVGFWGKPSNPARGDMAWKIYDILTVVDVVVMLFLVFFVFDTTFRCLLFVTRLVKHRTQWPRTTKECFNAKYGFNERPTDHGVLDDWIDMYFIAKRTRCINEIIYYPFAIIALMIVSRSAVFGDFALNLPIIIIQAICLLIVFGCAIALNLAAEEARGIARRHVSEKIIREKKKEGGRAGQWETLLDEINNMQEGAFRPFLQQPAFGAIFLPLSSIGWTTVIEKGIFPGL